jgi:uncharacterized protein with HEPN domain
MLEMCRLLRQEVARAEQRFRVDPVLQAAVQRWLEIIGEAAAGLSAELRDAHPDVPWRDVIGMRQVLAHGYFHVDLDIVWRVVERDLPELEQRVRRMLDELG